MILVLLGARGYVSCNHPHDTLYTFFAGKGSTSVNEVFVFCFIFSSDIGANLTGKCELHYNYNQTKVLKFTIITSMSSGVRSSLGIFPWANLGLNFGNT